MGRAPLLLLLPWLFVPTLRRGGERAGPRQGRSGRGQGLGGTWKRRGQGRGLRSERGSRVIGPGEGSRGWGLGGWWRRSRIGGGRAGGAGQGRCRCWGLIEPEEEGSSLGTVGGAPLQGRFTTTLYPQRCWGWSAGSAGSATAQSARTSRGREPSGAGGGSRGRPFPRRGGGARRTRLESFESPSFRPSGHGHCPGQEFVLNSPRTSLRR